MASVLVKHSTDTNTNIHVATVEDMVFLDDRCLVRSIVYWMFVSTGIYYYIIIIIIIIPHLYSTLLIINTFKSIYNLYIGA